MIMQPLGAVMRKNGKIYVAGHRGLVGSAIMRKLTAEGFTNIVTRSHHELDLRNQAAVNAFFAAEKPDYVFLSAAKVGGIVANNEYRGEFIYDNLMIQTNVIHAAYKNGVDKLLFLGSSCIYPRDCPQPIKEEYLLTGVPEKTNEPYALAKIAGLSLCDSYNRQYGTNFIACMPTNLYGPYDNFDLKNSHVLPALLRKMYEAKRDGRKEVVIWGTGKPYREFLYVDDLADAVVFLMNNYDGAQIVNIGTGVDCTIADLAFAIKEVVGFEGELVFDTTKPDGTPRKQLDVSRMHNLGWDAKISLKDGIAKTFEWVKINHTFE
jgi:GDP-L-fucose synthase